MRDLFRKAVIAAMAVVTITATTVAFPTSAEARWGWRGGGWGWGLAGLAIGTGLALAATAPYAYANPYYDGYAPYSYGYGYRPYGYGYGYGGYYPYYRRAYYALLSGLSPCVLRLSQLLSVSARVLRLQSAYVRAGVYRRYW